MLDARRREADALAARTAAARARVVRARARGERAKRRFLGNPVNLLLPFTAGTLGGALALYRKPRTGGDRRRRDAERVSLRSLIGTAATLWSASAALRESLAERRFRPPPTLDDRPSAVDGGSDGSAMPAPTAVVAEAERAATRAR